MSGKAPLIFKPHDYQAFCIDYIKTHPISALFLTMGLGKTVITLTALRDLMLDELTVSKILVIAPLRVARDTWPAEIKKWGHLSDLDCSIIVGDAKTRTAAVNANALVLHYRAVTGSRSRMKKIWRGWKRNGKNSIRMTHDTIPEDALLMNDNNQQSVLGVKK